MERAQCKGTARREQSEVPRWAWCTSLLSLQAACFMSNKRLAGLLERGEKDSVPPSPVPPASLLPALDLGEKEWNPAELLEEREEPCGV